MYIRRTVFGWLIFLLAASGMAEEVLVPNGAEWVYFSGEALPDRWTDGVGVDVWSSGPAQLGFGDRDEATVLPRGKITYYFVKKLDVVDASQFNSLEVSLLRDDGAVVYLNGKEWFRSNMPEGPIYPSTLAVFAVGDNAEDSLVLSNELVEGRNIIAVEMHQHAPDSSDVSFDFFLAGSDQIPPSTTLLRGPYLHMGSSTGMVVRWRTSSPCQSVVQVGESPDRLTMEFTSEIKTKEHEVVLSGLQPNTRYYYAISNEHERLSGGDTSHHFRTAPPTGSEAPIRIWALGDAGTGTRGAMEVAENYHRFSGDRYTDVWLMLGDNAYYYGTDQEYQERLFEIYTNSLKRFSLWATIGNHEERTSDSQRQWGAHYDNFTHPTQGEGGGVPSGTEAYYSFDYGNVHFICLNSMMDDLSTHAHQYTWLEQDLTANTQEWTLVFWHHVPYTKGSHDSDTEPRHIAMRENYVPLLESHGVDVVMGGHSHVYERSYLLHGHYGHSSTLEEYMILDRGHGHPDVDHPYQKQDGEGAVYVVSGSAGSVVSKFGLNHPVMHYSVAEMGSLVIDVVGKSLHGRFLDRDGNVDDAFILKHSAK